ncbi:alkaline ceramidase [Anaerocolumna sedimenticola]|uniref:Alkaline ceramidase n=1 Tax=Anaerocolumna sedimenticola TaxID=2696063 RepID=A0A6P1TMC0_9FIRM|nr:alkaline ceramidase [Anaerocolumna sedimenticola]QHQ61613.1 alkaline ceramidase [Anaerocolumna sedimenticola]
MKEEKSYKAAFSQIDITPEYQTTLVGRYRPDNSQGILDRLYAQVLLFQAGNEIFCLIAIDNLGLTVPLAKIIRLKTAEILSTEISHIMLNFSHTHSAPEPTPFGLNGERYFDFLCKRIVACVEIAKINFSACKIGWALTTSEIGENRRNGGTITDNRLGGLMIASADNSKPIALIVRIATHNNMLPTKNLNVSNDFIGVARKKLQDYYGYPIMFLQGAAGNIKAIGTNKIGEGGDDDLIKVAGILSEDVKKLHFDLEEIKNIQMFSREMTFIADVPSKEEAEKIAADYPTQYVSEWLQSCEELRFKGEKTQEFTAEISFLKLNKGCICGVSEEIFCELALDAQDRANNPLLFLNGYTNGCTGYLPSREEWYKGGYEVIESNFINHKYNGHVMPYRAETADQIVDLVVREWKRLKNCTV